MMRLPDGKLTADLDEYHDAWLSLGQQVEDLFPGYVMYGYNPGLSFTKDYGDSLRLSVEAARTLIARVKQQPVEELTAANATIDMLYERSGRFAAQADKYEQELKVAKAAILQVQSRLDDALALLSAKSAQLEAVLAKRLELGGALEAADQKIDELQERSAWFEAERHKDQLRLKSAEDEIKAAKEEKAEAIRLGDERLAVLWDMKQKEIHSLKAEIIRLRRHLGEIP